MYEVNADSLLRVIEVLEKDIQYKSRQLLDTKNNWLKLNGWEITSEIIGPTKTYFYEKGGELHTCEDHAMEEEMEG